MQPYLNFYEIFLHAYMLNVFPYFQNYNLDLMKTLG